MNARLTFRSLLTTTSMAALLVAAHGARATALYDNPFGTGVDQIYITTTVPYVSNAGSIENDYAEDGIEIYDTTVEGSVNNSGGIHVTDAEEGEDARGISVEDAYLWGDIENSGTIAVTASGSGNGESSRYAAGIDFGSGNTFGGSVTNSGSIEANALVVNVDGYCEDDTTSLDASAEAYGIHFDNTGNTSGGSIGNSDSIDVQASAKVDQSASDVEWEEGAYAEGTGNAHAYAAGIDARNDGNVGDDHRGPSIAGGLSLNPYNSEEGIDVNATAQSFSNVEAQVTCEGSGESCFGTQYAEGNVLDDATAQGYGVTLGGNAAVIGSIYNDATIDVYALAETHSVADASSTLGTARAFAGYREDEEDEYDEYYETSSAHAMATGLNVDVLQVDGGIESDEDIFAHAVANGQSTASASAPGNVEAGASNDAWAQARGIAVDTLQISGGFTNSAGSIGFAEATSDTKASAISGADAEVWASSFAAAQATGIDLKSGSLGGTFLNDNDDEFESEDGIVSGSALAHAISSAIATGGEYSTASASGTAEATAYGIKSNVDAIAGHFINEGNVAAHAAAWGEQTASISDNESLTAIANGGEIDAEATGIYVGGDTLAGSFLNDGNIHVAATASGTSTATANGLDDILAAAANSASAHARGIAIDENEIQDSIHNEQDVAVSALADIVQTATATASEEGEGDAAAISVQYEGEGDQTSASAYATGLSIYSEDIGGNIVNSDEITVDATANISSIISATASNDGDAWTGATSQAYAEAYGIHAQIGDLGFGSPVDDEEDYDNGYFVNDSLIDVHAGVDITETATSIADDGNAGAVALLPDNNNYCYDECGPDRNAVAYGISVGDSEEGAYLDGDFLNFGTVNAEATAVATLTAHATVDDGEDTGALTLAGGSLSSQASGISLDDVDADGQFYNDGEITATARTTINAEALADSDDGPAVAMIGSNLPGDLVPGFTDHNYAGAEAAGVLIEDGDFEDGFQNDGLISAAAFAKAKGKGEADGDETAAVYAGNSAGAHAVGVALSNSWFGDDIVNTGTIAGLAVAQVETTALAFGDMAEAYIGDSSSPAWASATATGLAAEGYYSGTVYNGGHDDEDYDDYDSEDGSGQIWALAGAFGNNHATAEGDEGAGAYAINAESASATGYQGPEYSSYSGGFFNDGLIVAGALAYGDEQADATASSGHGTAIANASDEADADATGVDMIGYELSNSGQIFAGALALSDAEANAEGDVAQANADASARATATGVSMYGTGSASLVNSGEIVAYAYARAHALATSDFDEDEGSSLSQSASASAHAVGVDLRSGSYFDSFANEEGGVIHAQADADATLGDEDDAEYGESSAYATGLYVDSARVSQIQNDGEISAEASGRDSATAYGIAIEGGSGTDSGTLTNTGTISAEASSENPYATAVLVTDGAWVSSISNSGDISATAEDTSEIDLFGMGGPQAVAIDVRGAGAGVDILQLKGSITGDILSDNEHTDTIDWSGGTINGDITGNESEDGDVLNVFAGENDAFTYNGTVDGFDQFNVNGGDHSGIVALRLTNTVRNVDTFHVGPNATLGLGTGANVSTNALNLDQGATLAFDVTSEGVNGVINTSSADLGGATVKAVFLDTGMPESQVYRIINWDGSDTRFGTVVSNSLVEKIVAQYGEDGVDLLATRLSFADVPGLKDDGSSFGKALDRVFGDIDPDSDLGKAIYQLVLLTPEEYSSAMNEIAGQQTADMQSVTFSQAGSLIHVIQTQLSELRGGTVAAADAQSLGIRVASNQVMASMSDAPQPGFGEAGTKLSGDWSAWARVFGDWAELDRSSVAAGFTSRTGGVVAGADYNFSPNFLAGLAGGYQSSNMDFRGTGEGDISSWSLTAYGDYRIGAIYVDALAGYSMQSYDMDRYLTVLGTGYVANSDYDGSSIIGSLETGYEIELAQNTKLTPFAGVNFTHTKTDAVTETGAGIWNLAYDDRSENGFDSVLGARLSKSYVTDGGTKLTPTIELGWKHAFGDASPIANAALSGTPGSNFQIFGSTASRDTAIVGAALSIQMTETIDAYVQYNGQYSSNYMDNTASLRLRLKF